jgi:predicted alpha-1,2-mannosidase
LSIIISLGIIVSSCSDDKTDTPFDYVNPFIGTDGHGHTYPGATMPFGMVQLSPDTRKDNWDACSGYHYSDNIVYGFSHTHLSGTGVGDYGDIRFFPSVGELKTNVVYGKDYKKGYGSEFSHEMEKAEPGYYATYLIDSDIYASFTVAAHSGFHKYMFSESEDSHILLDLVESVRGEKINSARIEIINDSTIAGYRNTQGWANTQFLYFYASFSKAFKSWGIEDKGIKTEDMTSVEGDSLKAWFNFNTSSRESILLKVGLSTVDIQGAKKNLESEIPDWNFKNIRRKAKTAWEGQLGKISVFGDSKENKEIFYTAVYHSFLAPNISSDIDHRYRGHDKNIYKDSKIRMHTVFSLWDTFRALHPLFTIVQRKKTTELINSMLEMYSHDGLLPVWELAACETNCMIGYNAVPVITDAYAKGIRGFDENLALEAMVASANSGKYGLDLYTAKGYVPADKEGESVSKTLEYAYDDWCIAEMARLIKNETIYDDFIRRGQYYKNIFDKSTGFFRGKRNGRFIEPFDPTEVNFTLTEANSWQYNFFVPQDVNTHIELLGGDQRYETKLDSLFNSKSELSGRQQSDISGLIGQYAHGNEPSHHMAYLYNYVGKAWKTQKIVRKIMLELYTDKADGLAGNEDCGQMSAWYVLSAMGFYPVRPGSNKYILGSPLFDSVVIRLENGNKFKIIANNNSDQNIYIQSVTYNGKSWDKSYITQKMIMEGGTLSFQMGDTANKDWGKDYQNRPYSKIEDNIISALPSFIYESKTFEKTQSIAISSLHPNDSIFVSINEGEFNKYNKPFVIDRTATLKAKVVNNGVESFIESCKLIKTPAGRSIRLKTHYSSQYAAGGDKALIDMLRGGKDFKTGEWQGYHENDIYATVDLGKLQIVNKVGMGFLQDENSWIFMPRYVRFEVSENGRDYWDLGNVINRISQKTKGAVIKDFSISLQKPITIRYIRVFADNIGKCPEWHKGAGNKAWLFSDEIWTE